MKWIFITCASLTSIHLFSQPLISEISEVETLREHIYAGIPAEFKENKWERKTYNFSHSAAVGISDIVSSGLIYNDWPELENYLNDILQTIMPPELKEDSIIHAYIIADGGYNAFMTPSGIMFINLGLITELEDEASLASVMAHELGHYYQQHSLQRFIMSETGEFRSVFTKNPTESLFSIGNEYESDSLSMIWLQQSGYSLSGMMKSIKKMIQGDERRISLSEDKWEFKESSHPRSDKRLERLQNFLEEHPDTAGGKDFMVNRELFLTLKEQAKLESLKTLLSHYDYNLCIEKAFKYHLLDPNKLDYLYYILEGIRRKCYLNFTVWSANFITHRYYLETERAGKKEKMEMPHLFSAFYADPLNMSETEFNNLKADFYWKGSPKFITNEQAFVFFYRIAKSLGYSEAILSNALSITHDQQIRNQLLKEYLSKPDIKYRKYAQSLLNDSIWNYLPSAKLTILDNYDIVVRQGSDDILISPKEGDLAVIKNSCDSLFNYEGSTFIFLNDLKKRDIDEYRKFLKMEEFAHINLVSWGKKAELHILEPEFWETFRTYGVSEVEFVNFTYFEARKSERSIDAFRDAVNSSINDILNQSKRSRNLYVSFANMRIKNNSRMKIPLNIGYDMSFRETGRDELLSILLEHLEEKKKYDLKADIQYRNWQ